MKVLQVRERVEEGELSAAFNLPSLPLKCQVKTALLLLQHVAAGLVCDCVIGKGGGGRERRELEHRGKLARAAHIQEEQETVMLLLLLLTPPAPQVPMGMPKLFGGGVGGRGGADTDFG